MKGRRQLYGQRFDRLLVIGFSIQHNRGYWICLCDCGNVTRALISDLTTQRKRSCGCLQKEKSSIHAKARLVSLIGQRFGRLVVLDVAHKRGKRIYWLCRCDCGGELAVWAHSLKRGETKSCGCLRRELAIESATTHGLSHTKLYSAQKSRERYELKKLQDTQWTVEMELLLKTVFPVCVACGSDQQLSVDHVRPLSRGHGLAPGNAVILCKSCNSSKSNRAVDALPQDMRDAILNAANLFRDAWSRA